MRNLSHIDTDDLMDELEIRGYVGWDFEGAGYNEISLDLVDYEMFNSIKDKFFAASMQERKELHNKIMKL